MNFSALLFCGGSSLHNVRSKPRREVRLRIAALFFAPLCLSAQSDSPPATAAASKPFSEGAAALQRGDLPAAKLSFEKAVRQNPSDAQARNGLGLVLLSQNNPTAAIPHFQ